MRGELIKLCDDWHPSFLHHIRKLSEKMLTKEAKLARILFLASSPIKEPQLGLAREFNRIDEEFQKWKNLDSFDLEARYAVTQEQLKKYLSRFHPQIVHFSGHGSKSGKLVFLNDDGRLDAASPANLAKMFKQMNSDDENIRCVILNACYSDVQAKAISKHIPCVIGMSSEIPDNAAIEFAAGFYQSLASGMSIQSSFAQGQKAIPNHSFDKKAIAKLKSRKGVDPAKEYIPYSL